MAAELRKLRADGLISRSRVFHVNRHDIPHRGWGISREGAGYLPVSRRSRTLYDRHMDPDIRPLEEPLAELERRLIDEYLRNAGHDPDALRARHDDAAARKLLTDAAVYAATKLTEIESRSHYLREIHEQH